jgi:hypothetical protein
MSAWPLGPPVVGIADTAIVRSLNQAAKRFPIAAITSVTLICGTSLSY